MLSYIWPPVVQQGVACNLSISIPQRQGEQQYSALSVVLEDEALGCPVLDVQFPITQPAGTQSIKIIIDPRETGAGHIRLKLAGWDVAAGPSDPPPRPILQKLPLICLPKEAAEEVTLLFDSVVKERLLSQASSPSVSSSEQQPSGSSSHQQQHQDVDVQHMVVAKVHQECINPIAKDLATILCDPPAPYHRLKPACDRLIPKLVAYNMVNCHAVVRGWLAMMEDDTEQHGGPSMVRFLSEARVKSTGLTLGQAIDADYPSSCNSVESLSAFYVGEPAAQGTTIPVPSWNELPETPQPLSPSPSPLSNPQHQLSSQSGCGSSSCNDFVLTSFMPEQDQNCNPHLLVGIDPNDAASTASYTDDEDACSMCSSRCLDRSGGLPSVHGLPMLPICPANPSLSSSSHTHPTTCLPSTHPTGSTRSALSQTCVSTTATVSATLSPAGQLRTTPVSVLLSGFKGCCTKASSGPGGAVSEEQEYCDGYEQRFTRCWAARHQGLDASALVLSLVMMLVLVPWSFATGGYQQWQTTLGLVLLQVVPVLLSGILVVSKQQGVEKNRERVTVLSRAVNAAVLAGLCMVPEGQAVPTLLLRVANAPLLLRAAVVMFQNAYRAVLLRNVLLVSLVECLALGWMSVCAGAPLLPALVHALTLWVVAVLTSAMLDASSRRTFARAMLQGLQPGMLVSVPTKGDLLTTEEDASACTVKQCFEGPVLPGNKAEPTVTGVGEGTVPDGCRRRNKLGLCT